MGIEGKQDRKVWDTRLLPPPTLAPSHFFRSSSDVSVVLHVFSDEKEGHHGGEFCLAWGYDSQVWGRELRKTQDI